MSQMSEQSRRAYNLQQLYKAVMQNDSATAEKQLEVIPQRALTEELIFPRRGFEVWTMRNARVSAAATRGRSWTEWMKKPCMPWNPRRKFDAAIYKCTILHLAAVLGHSDLCRLLLDKGANVEVKDTVANSVLTLAAASGDVNTVKIIVAAGGLLSQLNYKNVSALHVACKQGSSEIVEILLQQPGIDLNRKSCFMDEIPLFCAAYYNHMKVAQVLLQGGADINKKAGCRLTAVHMAARKSNTDMINLLAENGAELNVVAKVTKGNSKKLRFSFKYRAVWCGTPLAFAVDNSQDGSSVKALLNHGADMEESTDSDTPLTIAILKCKSDVVQVLLEAGAKVNCPDILFGSSLITAIHVYHPGGWKILEANVLKCVQLLVEAGASLETINGNFGENCMHACVKCELHQVFAYLLEKGADPYVTNCFGRSAVELCFRGRYGNGRHWMMKCLQGGLLYPAALLHNTFCMTPLDYALFTSDLHMIKMFEAAGLLDQVFRSEATALNYDECTDKVLDYFESALTKVMTLKNISRQVVSETIGPRPGRRAGIEALPIPAVIKRFLMYEDLLHLLERMPTSYEKSIPVAWDNPVHTVPDWLLIQNRGSESEIAQLNPADCENYVIITDMRFQEDDGQIYTYVEDLK